MGDIDKPDLSSLVEFLLVLGIMVQKKRSLERMGYR